MGGGRKSSKLWNLLGCLASLAGLLFAVRAGASQPGAPAVALIPCQIQGSGFSSPYFGQIVQTQGIVTVDLDDSYQRGFYLQANACDGDPATSDGIFVFLGERLDLVNSGDLVSVKGGVSEYYGLTEILTSPEQVVVLSSGNALPPASLLDPPFDPTAARAYFESLEGMLVELDAGIVIGPTDDDDRTWLVHARHAVTHVFYDDPAGVGERICADDAGPFEIAPEVKVGDLVQNLGGVLDFRYGEYCLALLRAPLVAPGSLTAAPLPQAPFGAPAFTLATFNLGNLFDPVDDPLVNDSVLSKTEYQRRLQKRALAIHQDLGEPDLIAIQEVENLTVTQALVTRPEIEADYGILWQDAPDSRGLDLALLYKTDRYQVLEYEFTQGCTDLIDGLGPDGNQLVESPQNAVTCDTDGDGDVDGNRLFSRPPLVARLRFCPAGCPGLADLTRASDPVELWVIANHFKSKTEDTDLVAYTLPRRVEQAAFVADRLRQIRSAHPAATLLVMGDLNDLSGSAPLLELNQADLLDLITRLARADRYTYIYQGIAQELDHILLSAGPGLAPLSIQPVHINADYPVYLLGDSTTSLRSSDHDPLWLRLGVFEFSTYLPIMMH